MASWLLYGHQILLPSMLVLLPTFTLGSKYQLKKLISNTDLSFLWYDSLHSRWESYYPGPGCSKLTMSLVNVSLNFQKFISQICQYFLLKNVSFCNAKASLIFSTKNISVFGY